MDQNLPDLTKITIPDLPKLRQKSTDAANRLYYQLLVQTHDQLNDFDTFMKIIKCSAEKTIDLRGQFQQTLANNQPFDEELQQSLHELATIRNRVHQTQSIVDQIKTLQQLVNKIKTCLRQDCQIWEIKQTF